MILICRVWDLWGDLGNRLAIPIVYEVYVPAKLAGPNLDEAA